MLVPADNMMASVAYDSAPLLLNATIGNVPPSLRRAESGARSPVKTFNIPPVPKVILVIPGEMQPWPTSEPC
ncbi:unannotated protein [freshwater metagenome]|uniref:Unannotated protein n=1 Tax=freshwater metagenome TaxID=449393 RepID=A0A6J6D892_9ZZZZ